MADWEQRLDVVNCAKHFDDIAGYSVYICPTQGNNYSHRRSKYFGLYRNKSVELVAHIDAVVDVGAESAQVVWNNVDAPSAALISAARGKHQQLRPGQFPKRVFLLSDCHMTDFRKDSPGGMFPSKQYFDVGPLGASNSRELAARLNGRSWSEV